MTWLELLWLILSFGFCYLIFWLLVEARRERELPPKIDPYDLES